VKRPEREPESHFELLRSGDYIVWRIDLPPGSESLSYRISAREL
jgi:hypothetical protein